jgi:adenylate kinase family enzyme
MAKTIFVNLMGGPGIGKSTLCSMIFSELKIRGVDCEMALEYAKDVIWEESFQKLSNQVYIFGKQHNRLYRLNGKVDVVITDSPLLNSVIYDNTDNKELKSLVINEFKKLNTLNYYIERSFEYKQNGRVQNHEQALQKDKDYKELLDNNQIDYKYVNPNIKFISNIIEDILYKVKND